MDQALSDLIARYGIEGLNTRGVLVVDDEPENLDVIRALLEEDFHVYSAESGMQALEIAGRVNLDVVIADQRMPVMAGVELLGHLRSLKPDVARILLTAYGDMGVLTLAINHAGVFHYLKKPWQPEELQAVVVDASREVFRHRAIIRLVNLLAQRGDELSTALEQLKATQREMMHLERVSTIGRLTTGLVHDLRNAMLPFTLLESTPLAESMNPSLREDLALAIGGVANILETLTTISNFARKGRLDLAVGSVEPRAIVDDALHVMKIDGDYRSRDAEVRVEDGLPTLCGDRQKLVQVMVNLIRNAVQATSAGQRILIEAKSDNGEVVFVVEDEGRGIPDNVRSQIFTPFFSTKGEQGVGMGLYMARLIVESHRGKIECCGRPSGNGTCIAVRLTPGVGVLASGQQGPTIATL